MGKDTKKIWYLALFWTIIFQFLYFRHTEITESTEIIMSHRSCGRSPSEEWKVKSEELWSLCWLRLPLIPELSSPTRSLSRLGNAWASSHCSHCSISSKSEENLFKNLMILYCFFWQLEVKRWWGGLHSEALVDHYRILTKSWSFTRFSWGKSIDFKIL